MYLKKFNSNVQDNCINGEQISHLLYIEKIGFGRLSKRVREGNIVVAVSDQSSKLFAVFMVIKQTDKDTDIDFIRAEQNCK